MYLTSKLVNKRIYIIYGFTLLFMIILAGRLFYLQIYQHEELAIKAEKQQKRNIKLSKKRGLITDRNGNILAIDTQAVSLYAFPKEYNVGKYSIGTMAGKIAPIIEKDPAQLRKMLATKSFTWLKRQMPIEKLPAVKALKIPGINYVYESKRVYPKKELGAALIGFTGIDNQGLTGIEHSFDNVLTAKSDDEKIFVDAIGYEILRKQESEPYLASNIKANKVVLTLDENIQYFAAQELKKGVEEYKAERGVAIVMDLDNGDLLALSTYPTFDPNNYADTGWEVIKNWAVTDIYEPGSTMKIFSIAAALEEGKLTLDEEVVCPGAIKVGKWTVHDHGMAYDAVRKLKPIDIIATSSNVGTSLVTRRIPQNRHRDILLRFGFGKPTDSGLAGEVGGILPKLPWRESRQSTISFGQGISVTPLQIVTAMSTFAREGMRIEPRIIKKILDPEDNVIKEYKSKEFRTLSQQIANDVRDLMVEVVQGQHGTARATRIPGYRIAGKTGTADKVENKRYRGNVMSSFIGFFPADKPKYLTFVLFDSPKTAHYASMTAVPVFKNIVSKILVYEKIAPTNPEDFVPKTAKR